VIVQFPRVQRLRALDNDVADVLAGRQLIRHSRAKHLNGDHAGNVRYQWWQTFTMLELTVYKI